MSNMKIADFEYDIPEKGICSLLITVPHLDPFNHRSDRGIRDVVNEKLKQLPQHLIKISSYEIVQQVRLHSNIHYRAFFRYRELTPDEINASRIEHFLEL